jgi:hypothetical protein
LLALCISLLACFFSALICLSDLPWAILLTVEDGANVCVGEGVMRKT